MSATRFYPSLQPQGIREDVVARLRAARFGPKAPIGAEGDAWRMGTSDAALRHIVDHWLTRFDWDKAEQRLTRFAHWRMEVEGLNMHYIHENGSADEVFDVVAPSLPGYGWSDAPAQEGMNAERVADMLNALMLKLGYDKYVVQGGDWGGIIARCLGIQHPTHCVGVHLNFCVASPPPRTSLRGIWLTVRYLGTLALAPLLLGKNDGDKVKRAKRTIRNECGYQAIQGTKPATLGYALNDSVLGLTSWILEKFHGWTDNDGDVFSAVSEDTIITNILIYWVTETMPTSVRLYFESLGMRTDKDVKIGSGYCGTPTAIAMFPRDLFTVPRAAAKICFSLAQWTEYPDGGHFAALERPEVLEKDVRRFFFQTRTFPALVQDAQRSRPKNMPWDTVDWIFAALMMAFVAYFLRAMV